MKNLAARLTLAFAAPSVFGKTADADGSPEISTLLKMDKLSDDYARLLYEVYNFAVSQDLVHIAASTLTALGAFSVSEATNTDGNTDEEALGDRERRTERLAKIRAAYDKQLLIAVTRYHRITTELKTISAALEAAKIDFIPLKGSVIREYYPDPKVRTSCDIDILVKREDLERADEALRNTLGLTRHGRNAHDVSYYTKSGIHLELHFELIESFNNKFVAKTLEDVWSYASPKAGYTHQCELTGGMYYFYHIAHMAKHFINGGLGIRQIMDIAVMKHTGFINVSDADALLEQGSLTKFSEACQCLCDAWFFDREHTELTARLESKLLGLSIYGTQQSYASMRGAKSGSKFKYILSRIFYSYEMLCNVYPSLEGHRWKTPFYQVKRWSNLIFKRGRMKNSINELRKLKKVSSDELTNNEMLIESLGLDAD